MAVSLQDKSSSFTAVTESKLLAVPYAFYAVTASSLVNGQKTGNVSRDGVTSNVWSTQGNLGTDPANDALGTSDLADLVIETNNLERMRITKDGNVQMKNSVAMNTAGGTTTNNGDFTVANNSATDLTGTLDVTGSTHLKDTLTTDGITNLNNDTQSDTTNNGALVVAGGAGVGRNLNVGGDLDVAGSAILGSISTTNTSAKSMIIKDNNSSYLATFRNTNDGDGDGIKIQLGKERPLDLGSYALPTYSSFFPGITNAVSSSIFKNGAFNTSLTASTLASNLAQGFTSDFKTYADAVTAGLCHLTNLIIDQVNTGIDKVNNTLHYNLATPINNGLHLPLDLGTPINHALGLPLSISKPINDALKLPNNIGSTISDAMGLPYKIADATIIPAIDGPTIPAVPSFSIPSISNFTIKTLPDLYLPAIPDIPKITDCPPLTNPFSFDLSKFPSASTDPLTKNNEFVAFFDKDGNKVGAIRGQSLQDKIAGLTSAPALLNLATNLFVAYDFDGGGTDPIGIVKVGARTLDYIVQTWSAVGKLGVEYSSGAGDYAEWLQRLDPKEHISTGDIVAVKGGKITKNLAGAEQIMAVSDHPIVLGNVPDKNKVSEGNNVAFMGQIPVKIMGPVKAGDYIVAKGNIPGYGKAVDPRHMKIEDYKLAVGRSWDSNDTKGPKMVNTVVGVHNNEFLKILKNLQDKVDRDNAKLSVMKNLQEKDNARLNAIESKLRYFSSYQKN